MCCFVIHFGYLALGARGPGTVCGQIIFVPFSIYCKKKMTMFYCEALYVENGSYFKAVPDFQTKYMVMKVLTQFWIHILYSNNARLFFYSLDKMHS